MDWGSITIERCKRCWTTFDPLRVVPKHYCYDTADDISQHYCSYECFELDIENALIYRDIDPSRISSIKERSLLAHFHPVPIAPDIFLIHQCIKCKIIFDPARIVAGTRTPAGRTLPKFVENDFTEHYCSQCLEQEIQGFAIPAVYGYVKRAIDDPKVINRAFQTLRDDRSEREIRTGLNRLIDDWNDERQKAINEGPIRIREVMQKKIIREITQNINSADDSWIDNAKNYLRLEEVERQKSVEEYFKKWDKDYDIAAGLHQQFLAKEQDMKDREAEQIQRQWEKDYIAAESEHEKFREQEAHKEARTFKPIPDHLRIHTSIIAKTGWGKTQLLQTLILEELKKPNPPSLIILDSTGQMVDLIQHLAVFNDRLRDRILIIDPAHSPSLNMFDLSTPRFETYSREQKEDIQNEIVTLFNYVFASEEYKLTGQMGVGFAYAVRLILSRPNSTIRELRLLLEENCKRCEQSAYASDIANLDEDAQDFFRKHFYGDELTKTRAAIARRLQLLLSVPAFARMFVTSHNTLDFYAETQDKHSIILVNTNELVLKDSYILFGRYIVARTMAAIIERASIPRAQRTVTHLIIDEGSPYMDETFDTLLTRVRQYGLKVTIAFQHFQQLDDKLKNSVAGQTSVKYAGGLSYQDARFLANEMRSDPDFLTSLKTDISHPPKWTQFAVYADNWNDNHSMLLTLPFLTMEREPKMTADQYAAMIARNRQRVAPAPQVIQKPQTTAPKQDTENPSVPESHKPPREPSTPTQAPTKSAPAEPHIGDHAEPASKWGDQ